MTDTRPVWLLDVDGVLNANKPGWGAAPHYRLAYVNGVGYRMRWAPALMKRIRDLHASGAVEIRWATTWIGHTDQLARMFGLPDFEPAYPAPRAVRVDLHSGCKLLAAMEVLPSGRRLIWTDDEAIPPVLLADPPPGALFIAPRSNRGLQPDHLDAIEAFLAGAA